MGKDERDYIDAEFEEVDGGYERQRWWQGWRISFDWRVFAVITGGALIALLRALVG